MPGKNPLSHSELFELLEAKYKEFNTSAFIDDDPVGIPHEYSKLQDVEIAAFFAATFAWGQRKTIINKCHELFELMDNSPHDFVVNHTAKDLERLKGFKHRTFNTIDLFYFLKWLKTYYCTHASLETVFQEGYQKDQTVKSAITHFHEAFFSLEGSPDRTRKHVATPLRKSTCKRLNMFLRWMVRKDPYGVDFGLWHGIDTSALMCPYDVHVDRVGRKLGLVSRKQSDWQTVEELTQNLRKFDPKDPVKYDFALFGLGVLEGFS